MTALKKAGMGPQAVYFGKLPARGDFVRSATGGSLIHKLDTWMSQTLELMAQDTRWKLTYDAARPVHFTILGPDHRMGLAGHLAASRDTSGRRFPFLRATAFDVSDPGGWLADFPMTLMPVWQRQQQDVQAVVQTDRFSDSLLTGTGSALQIQPSRGHKPYADFSKASTLAQLTELLTGNGPAHDACQTMMALGMLLQPVRHQGTAGLSKGIMLPLPPSPEHQALVMSLWSSLIAPFFKASHVELAFLACSHPQGCVLIVDFHGLSPVSLRAALDPDFGLQQTVSLAQADWVEPWVGNDFGLRKLSNLLRDPSLSWSYATSMFHETFLAE